MKKTTLSGVFVIVLIAGVMTFKSQKTNQLFSIINLDNIEALATSECDLKIWDVDRKPAEPGYLPSAACKI